MKFKKSILFIRSTFCSVLISTGFTNDKISDLDLNLIPILQAKSGKLNKSESATLTKDTVMWSASGSTRMNKDRTVITLKGNAKFKCNAFSILADEITYNKNIEKVFAKNYIMKTLGTDGVTKGSYGEFSLNK